MQTHTHTHTRVVTTAHAHKVGGQTESPFPNRCADCMLDGHILTIKEYKTCSLPLLMHTDTHAISLTGKLTDAHSLTHQ